MPQDLVRDVGCRADLLWRCDLGSGVDAAVFAEALRGEGFDDGVSSGLAGLQVLEEPRTGHRVVLVLRTGRIQLRLAAETGHQARVAEAQRLYRLMCVHGCTATEASAS